MNGQSQGRSTPFSGKKLFALTAVALMVVSCLAAFAVVDETKAGNTKYETIEITVENDVWTTEFSAPGFSLVGHTITFNGFSGTFSGCVLNVNISKLSNLDEENTVTINIVGTNNITCEPSEENGTMSFLDTQMNTLKLIGNDKSTDIFNITFDGKTSSTAYFLYTMGTGIQLENVGFNCTFNGNYDSCNMAAMGMMYPSSIIHSDVNISLGDTSYAHVFETSGDMTINDSKLVITPKAVTDDYIGINVGGKLSISNSEVTVGANTSGTDSSSYGIMTASGDDQTPTITGSTVMAYGRTTAVCASEYDPSGETKYVSWDSSKFTESTVTGAKTIDATVLTPISGMIGTDYKIVKISSSGPAPTTTHKVTFNLNGGDGDFPVIEKPKSEPILLPSTTPTKEGYTFHCWKGNDGNEYMPSDIIPANSDDLILTAQWDSSPEPVPPAPSGDDSNTTLVIGVIVLLAILAVIAIASCDRKQ